jgi:putative ABC transport system substrate-binding protein
VVFVNVSDPVSTGLVSSLAHPGGNITGFTNYDFAMGGKWLEILKQVAPSIMRVAVVFNPDNPGMSGQLRSIDTAGQSLGIQVVTRPARDAEEIERAIDGSAAEASGSLLILLDFVTLAHREQIIKFANQHRLPAGYGLRVFAADGGLFSYGVDASDLFRRGAGYVDRILKGEKPADLPVQYPIKFELVINLKTAKAMGLVIPESVLAVADEVIE